MRNRKKRPGKTDSTSELRALLGRVRSKGFKVDDRQRAFLFRTGLQRVLMTARTGSDSSVDLFFETLRNQTPLDQARFFRQPIGHDYLFQLIEGEPLPIEHEIGWIAARLNYERVTIHCYLRYAASIQTAFLVGDLDSCLTELNKCEREIGISLWSTELKLGLTQAAQGQEAQKAELKQIRTTRRNGMWPYLANAASVRAEPSVSISWFLEEARRRQERLKRNEFTDYLKYKSLGVWPNSQAGCARVLKAEQSHHIVDVYETFVSFLQEAVTRSFPQQVTGAISDALQKLRDMDDSRLRKLQFALTGDTCEMIPALELDLIDSAFDSGAGWATIRHAFAGHISAERILGLALILQRTTLASVDRSSMKMIAVRGVAEALRRTGLQSLSGGRSGEKLKKLVYVFGAIPVMKSVRLILEAAAASDTVESMKKVRLAALNSPEWGMLDLVGFNDHPAYGALRGKFKIGPAVSFADRLATFTSSGALLELREDIDSLASATSLFLAAKSDAAVDAVEPAVRASNRVVSAQASIVALNALARTGDVSAASNLITREHVDHGVDPESMPVRGIFQDQEWRDLREAAAEPELSISLSLIQSTEGDDKLRTYRRFALETLLKKYGLTRPSELRSVELGWRHSVLVHFLSHVCTAPMLDMLPSIRSSREVLEERREVCGYLATIDKANTDIHQYEVLEISRELTVLDGLRTIDGSRVHVDTDSLSRRLKVDLAESFQRYAALVEGEDEAAEGLLTILKDLNRRDQPPDYLLSMPVSEADELLVSMIVRSRERFLRDIPHGLDSYIGKRIRHGSIVGVVRAPAEREGVVAKRNLDGTYRPNGTWADVVADSTQRSALAGAIRATSKVVDEHLIRLRDVLLHVKGEEKPHGLFDCALTPPSYLIIRSVARSDVTLEGFVDTMFKSLWGMLGPSLLHAQTLLRRDSANFVSEQFQSLRVRAQKILKDPAERAAFDAAAVNASVGMQTALVAAASWFEPAESVPRGYTLEEVIDIAVASVRATKSGFEPKIELTSASTFTFSELALPLVCDVFYIGFGNVAAHAIVDGSPIIRVDVERDCDEKYLVIKIENGVAFDTEAEFLEVQSKLEEIRQEIRESKGVARARSDIGSGLSKLAIVVSQVEGDTLEFECTQEKFMLRFQISYSPNRPF